MKAIVNAAAKELRPRFFGNELRSFFKNPASVLGALLLVVFLLAATLGPVVAPYGYDEQNLRGRLRPPVWIEGGTTDHPLGTDALGRDLLTRILYGARVSLALAAAGVALGAVMGVSLGMVSGYFGGRVDNFIMRLADIQLSFPYLLLAIAVVAAFGTNLVNLVLVLGLRTWVVYARTVRSSVLTVRALDYVQAAVAAGASSSRTMLRHILPNVSGPLIVVATVELAQLVLMEATLSFLGLGVQPPYPSWGTMLSSGRDYLSNAWWLATFPGLAILVAVLGANLLGDGLRDFLDKRSV